MKVSVTIFGGVLTVGAIAASALAFSPSQSTRPEVNVKQVKGPGDDTVASEKSFLGDREATGTLRHRADFELKVPRPQGDDDTIGILMQTIYLDYEVTGNCGDDGPQCPGDPGVTFIEWQYINYSDYGMDAATFTDPEICIENVIDINPGDGAEFTDDIKLAARGEGCSALAIVNVQFISKDHSKWNDIDARLRGEYGGLDAIDVSMGTVDLKYRSPGWYSGVSDEDGDGVEDISSGPSGAPELDDLINSDPSGTSKDGPLDPDPTDPDPLTTTRIAWISWDFCTSSSPGATTHVGDGRDFFNDFLDMIGSLGNY